MRKPIIGVTERGDASIDLGWAEKLNQVDGAIIISKNLTRQLRELLLAHAGKLIFHMSITGWGGFSLEPNLPEWHESLARLQSLVSAGFPRDHIVVRVDPIIPDDCGISIASVVLHAAYSSGFRRARVSVLDGYPHVRERFREAGIDWPYGKRMQASDEQIRRVDKMLQKTKTEHPGLIIETCAERNLKSVRHCGCVSEYDLNILGIEFNDMDAAGYQRTGCMCYSGKRELLNGVGQCAYRCAYCYWKA